MSEDKSQVEGGRIESDVRPPDPRINVLKQLTTRELAILFIDLCKANPTGDEDWKHLVREELKTRLEYKAV
ncbi:MAG TPA: hypothetical protein VK619_10425 [Pyrinomonadaceae bacterium]|nr:hypothetical protein [Pyrinomonadaceae bacterium]